MYSSWGWKTIARETVLGQGSSNPKLCWKFGVHICLLIEGRNLPFFGVSNWYGVLKSLPITDLAGMTGGKGLNVKLYVLELSTGIVEILSFDSVVSLLRVFLHQQPYFPFWCEQRKWLSHFISNSVDNTLPERLFPEGWNCGDPYTFLDSLCRALWPFSLSPLISCIHDSPVSRRPYSHSFRWIFWVGRIL